MTVLDFFEWFNIWSRMHKSSCDNILPGVTVNMAKSFYSIAAFQTTEGD